MWFSSWLRNSQRSDSTPTLARKRLSFRPQLEALENRWLLSTLTVLNTLDSGAGSLRAEIAVANSNDTIVFAPSLDNQTIKLTSGELVINKTLTIQGPGAGALAISGGNNSRVFEVYGFNTNVMLSGLTITQGNGRGNLDTGDGGGILNMDGSTLTISGCTLSNNRATFEGGGVANQFAATLNILNSTLSGNIVNDGNGGGEGGGVYSIGGGGVSAVSMTDCILSNNRAGYAGGGVYINSTTMTVSGCTLSGNSARLQGNDITNANAGSDKLTVSDSVFSNNTPYSFFPILGPWINGGGNTEVK